MTGGAAAADKEQIIAVADYMTITLHFLD